MLKKTNTDMSIAYKTMAVQRRSLTYLACKQVTRLFCGAVAYLLLFCYSTSKYLSEPTHELVNLFDMDLLSFILSKISKQKSKT